MAQYYPKNRIKTNQYTYGNEWFGVNDGLEYIGFYYILSSGKAYKGKSPEEQGGQEEIHKVKKEGEFSKWPVYRDDGTGIVNFSQIADNYDGHTFETQFQEPQDVNDYINLIGADATKTRFIPVYEPTFPTDEDYQIGYFTRYFVVKENELVYTEISKKTFDALEKEDPEMLWELYKPFQMRWTISGRMDDVFIVNNNMIKLVEKQIQRPKFNRYLTNSLEYYRYVEGTNLIAPINLLIDKDGNDYVGPYHIHIDKGPMEGANHVDSPHQKLFYKRFYDDKGIELLVSSSFTSSPTITLTGEESSINYNILTGNDPSSGASSGGGTDPQMPDEQKDDDYGEPAGGGTEPEPPGEGYGGGGQGGGQPEPSGPSNPGGY